MIEKAVGISKSIMKKARKDRRDYLVGLMEYINTPISGLDLSPAQMMFNRRLKTKLPISNKLLNAELFNNIREKLIKRQNVQKIHSDKTVHSLPELEPEDNVRILNFKNKIWEQAKIVSKHKLHPRSYFVKAAVAEGYRYRTGACLVTSLSPEPLKTRRVGQRCMLNLSRAETSSRWCGVVFRRGGASSGVVHVT
ncbi:transposon Tf2-6 polyprotein [Trichonephila clavipes]|nr:transposon Tf2-6 polyprotein [Trichonephila clavipes]